MGSRIVAPTPAPVLEVENPAGALYDVVAVLGAAVCQLSEIEGEIDGTADPEGKARAHELMRVVRKARRELVALTDLIAECRVTTTHPEVFAGAQQLLHLSAPEFMGAGQQGDAAH